MATSTRNLPFKLRHLEPSDMCLFLRAVQAFPLTSTLWWPGCGVPRLEINGGTVEYLTNRVKKTVKDNFDAAANIGCHANMNPTTYDTIIQGFFHGQSSTDANLEKVRFSADAFEKLMLYLLGVRNNPTERQYNSEDVNSPHHWEKGLHMLAMYFPEFAERFRGISDDSLPNLLRSAERSETVADPRRVEELDYILPALLREIREIVDTFSDMMYTLRNEGTVQSNETAARALFDSEVDAFNHRHLIAASLGQGTTPIVTSDSRGVLTSSLNRNQSMSAIRSYTNNNPPAPSNTDQSLQDAFGGKMMSIMEQWQEQLDSGRSSNSFSSSSGSSSHARAAHNADHHWQYSDTKDDFYCTRCRKWGKDSNVPSSCGAN